MSHEKSLLQLFLDVKQPYFYGLLFVLFTLLGLITGWDWTLWAIHASAAAGGGMIVYYLVFDSIQKIKAGWKPTVFIIALVAFAAMIYLSRFITTV